MQGTAHFEVDQNRGRQLVQELSACLSGYAVPNMSAKFLVYQTKHVLNEDNQIQRHKDTKKKYLV